MDFLGLRNLSVIKNCIKIIKIKHEKDKQELPQMFKDFLSDTTFSPPIDDKITSLGVLSGKQEFVSTLTELEPGVYRILRAG